MTRLSAFLLCAYLAFCFACESGQYQTSANTCEECPIDQFSIANATDCFSRDSLCSYGQLEFEKPPQLEQILKAFEPEKAPVIRFVSLTGNAPITIVRSGSPTTAFVRLKKLTDDPGELCQVNEINTQECNRQTSFEANFTDRANFYDSSISYDTSGEFALHATLFVDGTELDCGTTNSSSIEATCPACPAGFYCDLAGTHKCPPGSYCVGGDQFNCTEGYYCTEQSQAQAPCGSVELYCGFRATVQVSVQSGYFSIPMDGDRDKRVGEQECGDPAHYCIRGERKLARDGYYTVADEGVNVQASPPVYGDPTKRAQEIKCEEGWYCKDGIRNECALGYLCPSGASEETACCNATLNNLCSDVYCKGGKQRQVDTGFYSVPTFDETTGQPTDATHRQDQEPCDKGYYCENGERIRCANGTRCDGGGGEQSKEPQLCSGETETTADGEIVIVGDASVYCVQGILYRVGETDSLNGYYSTPEGTSKTNRTGQKLCDAGYRCDVGLKKPCGSANDGDNGPGESVFCTDVPQVDPGSTTDPPSNYKLGVPIDVRTGYYSTPTDSDPNMRTGQAKCEVGFYCLAGKREQCNTGFDCSQEGSTIQTPCDEGWFCEQGKDKVQCEPGLRCARGTTEKIPCLPSDNTAKNYDDSYCRDGKDHKARPGYYAIQLPGDAGHSAQLPCACKIGVCTNQSDTTDISGITEWQVVDGVLVPEQRCCNFFGRFCRQGKPQEITTGQRAYASTSNDKEATWAIVREVDCAANKLCVNGMQKNCVNDDGSNALCENGILQVGKNCTKTGSVPQDGVCKQCASDEYAHQPTLECVKCPAKQEPEVAYCQGQTSVNNIKLLDGFWFCTGIVQATDGACVGSNYIVDENTTFVKCEEDCSPKPAWIDTEEGPRHAFWEMDCPEGATGIKCALCDEGYGKAASGECQKCPKIATMIVTGIIVAFIFSALFFWFLKKAVAEQENQDEREKGQQVSSMVVPRIVANHLYLMGLLKNVNVDWGSQLSAVFALARAASGNMPPFMDCAFGFSYFQTFLIYMMLPPLAAAIPMMALGALAVVTKIRKRIGLTTQKIKEFRVLGTSPTHVCRTSVVLLLYLLYPAIAQNAFQMIDCSIEVQTFDSLDPSTRVPVTLSFLRADPKIECSQPKYQWYRGVAYFVIATFVPAFPAIVFGLLWRKRHRLDEDKVRQRYLFLYGGFKTEFFCWEVLIMIRELLCAALFVFDGQGVGGYQVYWGLCILLVSLTLHLRFQPFVNDKEQGLETLSLVVVTFTLFIGFGIELGGFSSSEANASRIIILLVNIVALIYFASQFLGVVFQKVASADIVQKVAASDLLTSVRHGKALKGITSSTREFVSSRKEKLRTGMAGMGDLTNSVFRSGRTGAGSGKSLFSSGSSASNSSNSSEGRL
jgi:hypothetical protein